MKKSLPHVFILLVLLITQNEITAQEKAKEYFVSGVVFHDKNENGTQDKNEKGIKGLLISNGTDIIKTGQKGRYSIMASKEQSVFPILPSGYVFGKHASKVGNANFQYIHSGTPSQDTILFNIPLARIEDSKPFRISAVGDIQVSDKEELDYAAKSVFSELLQRKDIQFNMMLGDLVNENLGLLSPLKDMMQRLPSMSWTMMGNHDRNTEDPVAMNGVFNSVFGADSYAFNYGGVHFIVLNNVYATGKRSYEGRIDDKQIQFLKNNLQYVPKDMTVVLSQHIPMAHTRNKKEVLELLKDYEQVLILSGHTHMVNRYFFNYPNIQELGVGATCGTWWRGEKDGKGVPDALMQCGTPKGYFTIDFGQGKYNIQYKGIDMDSRRQINLSVDSTHIIANVYGGGDSTQVYIQVDDEKWKPMRHVKRVAPNVIQIVEKNKAKIYPTYGNKSNPLRLRNSSHIWEADRMLYSMPKWSIIRITAIDSYGYEVTEEFMLYL